MVKKIVIVCCIALVAITAVTEKGQSNERKDETVICCVNACSGVVEMAENVVESSMRKMEERKAKISELKRKDKVFIKGASRYIRKVNRGVSEVTAERLAGYFLRYSKKYGVDEKILMAVAHNESAYSENAVSSANYKGIMQTGDNLAVNAGYRPGELFNPEISIKVGAKYIADKLEEFGGNVRLALTAYNQGSSAVRSGKYSRTYADVALERMVNIEKML